jgi:hypothetical protein
MHHLSTHTERDSGLCQVHFKVGCFNQIKKSAEGFDQVQKIFLIVKNLMRTEIVSKNGDTIQKKLWRNVLFNIHHEH